MDAFAQIAKSGIQGRYELLEQPKPTPLPDHVVCLKETNAQPTVLPEKTTPRSNFVLLWRKSVSR